MGSTWEQEDFSPFTLEAQTWILQFCCASGRLELQWFILDFGKKGDANGMRAQPSLSPTSSWENRLRSPGSQQGDTVESIGGVKLLFPLVLSWAWSGGLTISSISWVWVKHSGFCHFPQCMVVKGRGHFSAQVMPSDLASTSVLGFDIPMELSPGQGSGGAPGRGLPGRRQARGSSGSKCWSGDLASLTQFQVWPVRTKRPHAWQRLCSASVPGCRRGACSALLRVLFLGRGQRHWRPAAVQGDTGRAFTLQSTDSVWLCDFTRTCLA